MSNFHRVVITSALLMMMSAVLPARALPPGTSFHQSSTITQTCNQAQNNHPAAGSIVINGPEMLWPPNHKPSEPITFTIHDEDSQFNQPTDTTGSPSHWDRVALVVMASNSNVKDGVEEKGAGNTDQDINPPSYVGSEETATATGSLGATFTVLSERSGTDQAGRTYHFDVTATFTDSDMDHSSENMTMCATYFNVFVPHDMRPDNRTNPNPEPSGDIQGTGS